MTCVKPAFRKQRMVLRIWSGEVTSRTAWEVSRRVAQQRACCRVLAPPVTNRVREAGTPRVDSSARMTEGVLRTSAVSPGITIQTLLSGRAAAAEAANQLRIRFDSLGMPLPPRRIISPGVPFSTERPVPSQ